MNYSYKTAANDDYTSLGSKTINGTSWSMAEFDLSTINTLDADELYLKLEFTGGSAGNTQSCGTLKGDRYVPSYITVDNLMITGDRPALATLDGYAQTCSSTYVCEGNTVTFNCQGDNDYLKFYLVNETTDEITPFNGATELTVTPEVTSDYTIKAIDQISQCDSSWTFNVEVVKLPSLDLVRGTLDLGICGNDEIDNEFNIENAVSYNFTWLTDGYVEPAGVVLNDDGAGTISLSGTLTEELFVRYLIEAEPDARCASSNLQKIGLITIRKHPVWAQTIGGDTVCQGTQMQIKIDTADLNFAMIPEANRIIWSTDDEAALLSNPDTSFFTLNFVADEAMHSKTHYLTVNQNGCTTIDTFDIVVYDLTADNLGCESASYELDYGDYFLPAESLITPPLIHNEDTVPATMITSVRYRRTTVESWHQPTDSIFAPSIDNLNTTIYWQVTDICGNVHECSQNITFILPPCGEAEDFTATDFDGNEYATVRVGFNCWLKENLRSTHYSDGEAIANARPYDAIENYADTAQNALLFGRLYSWYDAARVTEDMTTPASAPVQGICPEGWFLPTEAQFNSLANHNASQLRSPEYWLENPGTNETGFSILPAGQYSPDRERCENLLGKAHFWTCEESDSTFVKSFMADCHCSMFSLELSTKSVGYSVRCIKGKSQN